MKVRREKFARRRYERSHFHDAPPMSDTCQTEHLSHRSQSHFSRQKDPGVSPARETLFMALARYLRASQAYPSTVQLATGAFVMAVGDASTQLAVEGGQTLDPNRIGCAAFFNGAISPVLHYWYQFLDRKFPGVSVRALAPKLIANQMVSSPILSPAFVAWSMVSEAWLAGELKDMRGCEEVGLRTYQRVRNDFSTIVSSSLCVWLPANAVNFALVPPHLRIAFMSTVACGWGGFLSFMAHRTIK